MGRGGERIQSATCVDRAPPPVRVAADLAWQDDVQLMSGRKPRPREQPAGPPSQGTDTVTRRKLAGMRVVSGVGLVLCSMNSASNSACR